jgi:hypothetical protein
VNSTFVIAISLVVLGGLIAVANWWSVISSFRTKRFHSAVPLLGAVLLGTGMFLLPATRPFCLIAVVIDYGTLALLLASPRLVREVWSTSKFNLVSEYLGQAGMKTVYLRLFRRGVFTIRLQLHRPAGERGLVGTGTVGRWQRDGTRLTLRTEQESAVFDVVRGAPDEVLGQSVGFQSWEGSDELSLAGIEFVRR